MQEFQFFKVPNKLQMLTKTEPATIENPWLIDVDQSPNNRALTRCFVPLSHVTPSFTNVIKLPIHCTVMYLGMIKTPNAYFIDIHLVYRGKKYGSDM